MFKPQPDRSLNRNLTSAAYINNGDVTKPRRFEPQQSVKAIRGGKPVYALNKNFFNLQYQMYRDTWLLYLIGLTNQSFPNICSDTPPVRGRGRSVHIFCQEQTDWSV